MKSKRFAAPALTLLFILGFAGTQGFRSTRSPASESGCMLKSPEDHYLFHFPQPKPAKGKAPEVEWTRTEIDLNDDNVNELLLTPTPKSCRAKSCPTAIYQKQPDGCFRSLGSTPSTPKVLSVSKGGYKLLEIDTPQGQLRFHFDPLISEYKPDPTVHAP